MNDLRYNGGFPLLAVPHIHMPLISTRLTSFLKFFLCLILFGLTTSAYAETRTLLIIDSEEGSPYDQARESMLAELAAQGYQQDLNLQVTRFSIENKVGIGIRLLRAEAAKHDVIFTNGTIASKAAHEFGYNHPEHKFVFCSVTDPIGLGLINAFNQPSSSNFTGVAYGVPVVERLRFLRKVLPEIKTIGMIHSDLPQSKSYINWLKQELSQSEFSDLNLVLSEIPYVHGDNGPLRMARLLEKDVKALSPVVDAFITPSDQLGTKIEYVKTLTLHSAKPLMALTEQELSLNWGAHFGAYPAQQDAGKLAAKMIIGLFQGNTIDTYPPTYAKALYGIHKPHSDQIGLKIPNTLWQDSVIKVFHK